MGIWVGIFLSSKKGKKLRKETEDEFYFIFFFGIVLHFRCRCFETGSQTVVHVGWNSVWHPYWP